MIHNLLRRAFAIAGKMILGPRSKQQFVAVQAAFFVNNGLAAEITNRSDKATRIAFLNANIRAFCL